MIVTQEKSGKRVPVVQAYAFTKYLGHLELTFDDDGNLIEIDGTPILLDASVPRSLDVLNLLEKYRPGVLAFETKVVGSTKVFLDGVCRRQECNLGNFITDSMVDFSTSGERSDKAWTTAAIGFLTGGNIRASINFDSNRGQITKEDALTVLPFGQQIETVEVSGRELLDALEHSVRRYTAGEARGEFPQLSGVHVRFDMSRAPGDRVRKVKVRCAECSIPEFHDLEMAKTYKIVTNDFLARGGDGFVMFKSAKSKKSNTTDIEVFLRYLGKMSPIFPSVEDRIEIEYSADPLFVVYNKQTRPGVEALLVNVLIRGFLELLR